VLNGKWRLDEVLGIGGMATVYAATHRNQKRVALKMLHPEVSIDQQVTSRFTREGYVANTVGPAAHDDSYLVPVEGETATPPLPATLPTTQPATQPTTLPATQPASAPATTSGA